MTAATVTKLTPKVSPEAEQGMDIPDLVAGIHAAAAELTNPRRPRKEQAQPAKNAPAKAAAAKKAPAKKAPAKKAPAKAAATPPKRDLTKVTASEQRELRSVVVRMVWATPLWKYRKDAGIPAEVPDQVIEDAIDVFAKYISPASYETKDGKLTRRT